MRAYSVFGHLLQNHESLSDFCTGRNSGAPQCYVSVQLTAMGSIWVKPGRVSFEVLYLVTLGSQDYYSLISSIPTGTVRNLCFYFRPAHYQHIAQTHLLVVLSRTTDSTKGFDQLHGHDARAVLGTQANGISNARGGGLG